MSETEKVINDLNTSKLILCNPQMLTPEICVRIGQTVNNAIDMLKEQPDIVRCKDCVFRDDRDGMCEHVQQVRDPNWYCADAERKKEI